MTSLDTSPARFASLLTSFVVVVLLSATTYSVDAFAPSLSSITTSAVSTFTCTSTTTKTSLSAQKKAEDPKQNEDLMRWARQARSASSDDNVVELMRPLGLVLNQDDNGNVYVETVAPKGNAARTGKVRICNGWMCVFVCLCLVTMCGLT